MDKTQDTTKGQRAPEARSIARKYQFRGQFRASELLGKKSYWHRLPELNIKTPMEALHASIGKLAPVEAMPEALPLERKHTSWMRGGNKGKLRSDHPLLNFVSRNLPNEFARISATVIHKLNQPRYSGRNRPRFADTEPRDDGGEIQFNSERATPRIRNGLTPDEQCDIHQTIAEQLLLCGYNGELSNDGWGLCFDAARKQIGADYYSASNTGGRSKYGHSAVTVPIESVNETELACTPATQVTLADATKRQRIARAFRKANHLACLAFRNDKSRKRKARFLRVIHTLRAHLDLRDDSSLFNGQSESTQRKLYFDLRAYLAEGQRLAMREAITKTREMLAQRKARKLASLRACDLTAVIA